MKIYFCFLIAIFLMTLNHAGYSQELKPITIHKIIGDTLTQYHNIKYGFITDINNFDHATFYLENDSIVSAKIVTTNNETINIPVYMTYNKFRTYADYLISGNKPPANSSPDLGRYSESSPNSLYYYDFSYTRKSLYDSTYAELGATLGTPGAFNLRLGYSFGPFVWDVSGFFRDNSSKIGFLYQVDIGFKLSDNTQNYHVLNLIFGNEDYRSNIYDYPFDTLLLKRKIDFYGFSYSGNISGFFYEIGISFHEKGFRDPGFVCQLGYVYRFFNR